VNRDAAWYAGRRVLVTGHTGFKGSWLCAWLANAGAHVAGYGLPPAANAPNLYDAARIGERVQSTIGDVRDRASLDALVREFEPEVVFHLAALALVRQSYREPVETYATNVMGTAHVLDAVRRTPSARAVVVVTSDKCYENTGRDRAYAEDDPLGGHDPYSSSKAGAEIVTAAMRRSFFADGSCGVASARAGNVIGGGDWSEDRLVPDVMAAAAAGATATIRNPDAIRAWQFVLEPLRGYLRLGRRLADDGAPYACAWNFGPAEDSAVQVRDVVDRLRRGWDRVAVVEARDAAAPHEAPRLMLDITKARTKLDWHPVLSLDETVGMTVSWYRDYYADPTRAPTLVDEQIAAYDRRASA
jgi:CDP-glucose 4,6-dehydratase